MSVRRTVAVVALFLAGCSPAPSPAASVAPTAAQPSPTPTAAPASAAVSSTPSSPSAAPTDQAAHIALGGRGPIGLDIVGDRAWVVLTDSGDLVEVDLTGQVVARTIAVGTGGSQVVATDDGVVYVGRFDTGGVGEHIAVVDSANWARSAASPPARSAG